MCTDKREIITSSEEETEAVGRELAQSLPPGRSVLLRGNLGAGKTVFSRGFARGLGITEPVSSPTYTIVQEYELPAGGRLYHLDLYRISDVNAALAFGVDEFLLYSRKTAEQLEHLLLAINNDYFLDLFKSLSRNI